MCNLPASIHREKPSCADGCVDMCTGAILPNPYFEVPQIIPLFLFCTSKRSVGTEK